MASWSNSDGKSGVQYYDGQRDALGQLFAPGGVFSQFMAGKPDAGFERQQTQGLEQLKRAQAANGLSQSPLGTRQIADYLQQSNSAASDNFMKTLFGWMNPAGQKSKSSASGVGIL